MNLLCIYCLALSHCLSTIPEVLHVFAIYHLCYLLFQYPGILFVINCLKKVLINLKLELYLKKKVHSD